MFLQVMNTEEKAKFLEYAYKIASIDGDFAEEEQEIINSYKNEVGLHEISDTSDIDGLIAFFSTKSDVLKKIVLFETIGLINADDKIAKEEEAILKKIIDSFDLDIEVVNKINYVVKKMQEVYDEVYDVLFD